MKKVFLILYLIFFLFNVYANDERNEVQASLKSVTVYRSGVELVHNASAILRAGNNEVIIDNISNAIDSNSIQITAPSSVTVLGFEFSNNYMMSTGKSPRRQMLEDSLQHIKDNIGRLDLPSTIPKNYWMYQKNEP
jgi:hypothetical protein